MKQTAVSPEFKRIAQAYVAMARQAKYRPAAPGDGFGGISLTTAELADPVLLNAEAQRYAERFIEEEDSHSNNFRIGISNYTTNRALVYAIEAARLLCGGADAIAAKLLHMAAVEVESESDIDPVEMSFADWLEKNRWREDPIGDLARDAHGDNGWPKGRLDLKDFKSYLAQRGACEEAKRALRRAWSEYQLFTDGFERV
jgi:uncharacterized protein YozE (UPF0346 family)